MKRILEKWDIIIGIVFLGYYVFLISLSSPIAFKSVFLCLGLGLVVYHLIRVKLTSKNGKIILRIINSLIIIGVIGFLFIESCIISYSKDNISEADYMIILGAGLNGEDLSLTLQQRLDKAIQYVQTYNKDIKIIVSGGQGEDELVSEASAMKKYLISQDIDDEQIYVEDKSTSTFENFKFSYEKLDDIESRDIGELNIKVVTSDFHAFRSNFIAERAGFKNITFYTNKTHKPIIPAMYTREAFAVIKSILFDR